MIIRNSKYNESISYLLQMQFSTFFTVLSAFVSLSFTSDAPPSTPNEEALILASKSMMNNYLVQGKEMAFRYSLYNVGGRLISE